MPIFGDPPEGLDEDWTHGALIGGMCGWWSEQELANSYFLAADLLVAAATTGRERGQDIWGPTMYLYRHGTELYLKLIVQPENQNHNLGSLLEKFCAHIRSRYKQDVPAWITRPISELHKFDPGSDLFRYREPRQFAIAERLAKTGEYWVDLRAIKREMGLILEAFQRVVLADQTGTIPPAPIRRHSDDE